jgi:hypothetical protein
VAFVEFKAKHYAGVPPVDKDPQAYVREEEEQQGLLDEGLPDGRLAGGAAPTEGSGPESGPDGSLSIGSLRTP